jgi:hypothetical protein
LNPSSLAVRFNEVSTALSPVGHRVVVRRARELLGDGRFDETIVFLSEASRRLSIKELAGLANDVRSWVHARGELEHLLADPRWLTGAEADDIVMVAIEEKLVTMPSLREQRGAFQRNLAATMPILAPSPEGLDHMAQRSTTSGNPDRRGEARPPPIPEPLFVEAAQPLSKQANRTPGGSTLPTGPLIAGIIMLMVLSVWFCLIW